MKAPGLLFPVALAGLMAASIVSAYPAIAPPESVEFDAGKAGFTIKYKEETSPYRVSAVFLMPGEILDVKIANHDMGRFTWEVPEGTGGSDSSAANRDSSARPLKSWKWKAPDSAGLYPLRLRRDSTDDTILLNAFVMVPAAEMRDGYLRGYHIGTYPKALIKGLEFYRAPSGFIRADANSLGARLSPHFKLGQFLCKQTAALPAYLLLKERLILKLELVLEKANQAGYACQSFHVMSGYRTPFYNHLIGNVKFSAHQFGGASDIFIDAAPEDGEMDDLNGDGRNDGLDSELLFKLVDGMSVNEYFLP